MDMRTRLRHAALQNAQKYGRANEKAVLGSALSLFPELRTNIEHARELVHDIVQEINALDNDALQRELAALPATEKQAPAEKVLKPLPGATDGNVVTRFAPSPSGPLHIGHAYMLALNAGYAKHYNGKFILRIEDTNPENIDPAAYDLIKQDAEWFAGDVLKTVLIQSERLGLYYDYAERLVQDGNSYVCTCSGDEFRTLILKKQACPCRDLPSAEHSTRYAAMFSTYKPGEAVLRAKTDTAHKNPAMRDFPLMRINEHPHPRTGTQHRVWPLMNLAVVVDDIETGVTHTIRAKDHADNAKRQEYLYAFLGKKPPHATFVGRINFTDMRVSCSATKALIQEGKYTGWADIRIPFLLPLRMRGYQPGAFYKWSTEVGTSLTDKTVDKASYFTSLDAYNKNIIDPVSERYYFIKDPVRVTIVGAPLRTIALKKHPDHPSRGNRELNTTSDYYLEQEDLDALDAGLHRLMDNLNFTKDGPALVFKNTDYLDYKEHGKRIMHWLPVSSDLVEVRILMPDGTQVSGIGEPAVRDITGGTIQFERFGFCNFVKKEGDSVIFWYAHR